MKKFDNKSLVVIICGLVSFIVACVTVILVLRSKFGSKLCEDLVCLDCDDECDNCNCSCDDCEKLCCKSIFEEDKPQIVEE